MMLRQQAAELQPNMKRQVQLLCGEQVAADDEEVGQLGSFHLSAVMVAVAPGCYVSETFTADDGPAGWGKHIEASYTLLLAEDCTFRLRRVWSDSMEGLGEVVKPLDLGGTVTPTGAFKFDEVPDGETISLE